MPRRRCAPSSRRTPAIATPAPPRRTPTARSARSASIAWWCWTVASRCVPRARTARRAGAATPLGLVGVDRAVVRALLEHEPFRDRPEAHAREHCLEIQLLFLQRTLERLRLCRSSSGVCPSASCARLPPGCGR
ncbi:MAG: AmmeMemoRadiSam system protein B [Planctomycetota bacterium]